MNLALVSFLSASLFVSPDYEHSLLYDALLVLAALTAGGILFGVAFLIMARSMNRRTATRTFAYYLTISAYGTVLLVVAITSPIIYTPYPPFAAAAWSFAGLSSYLYSLGFYFSAISIAQDSRLRQSIRAIALNESKLLDSIGTAHMEQELVKKVLKLAKEHEKTLEEQTGVEMHNGSNNKPKKRICKIIVLAEVKQSNKKQEQKRYVRIFLRQKRRADSPLSLHQTISDVTRAHCSKSNRSSKQAGRVLPSKSNHSRS